MRCICQKCFYRMDRSGCVLGRELDLRGECVNFLEYSCRNAFRVAMVDEYGGRKSTVAYDLKELLELVGKNAWNYDIAITLTKIYIAERDAANLNASPQRALEETNEQSV